VLLGFGAIEHFAVQHLRGLPIRATTAAVGVTDGDARLSDRR
jgi:hypothetical protein